MSIVVRYGKHSTTRRHKILVRLHDVAQWRRVQRSTKDTDRKKAQKLAEEWEAPRRGRVTARQTQKVIAELYRDITGQRLVFPTVREYFDSWVARKKPETSSSTYNFYQGKAQRFLDWLGNRADQQIALITRDDILAFRAAELERVSPRSVNHAIKFLRMVFKTAKEDGKYHDENPASGVKVAKLHGDSSTRLYDSRDPARS